MKVSLRTIRLADAHPNTALINLTGQSGKTLTLEACSTGGGRILVERINGLEADFSGDMPTLIVRYRDFPGMIAFVARTLAGEQINIATMRVFREKEGGQAMMVMELDGMPADLTLSQLREGQKIDEVTLIDRVD